MNFDPRAHWEKTIPVSKSATNDDHSVVHHYCNIFLGIKILSVYRDGHCIRYVTAGKCNWRHSGWSVRLVGFPQCYPACRFLTNKILSCSCVDGHCIRYY